MGAGFVDVSGTTDGKDLSGEHRAIGQVESNRAAHKRECFPRPRNTVQRGSAAFSYVWTRQHGRCFALGLRRQRTVVVRIKRCRMGCVSESEFAGGGCSGSLAKFATGD